MSALFSAREMIGSSMTAGEVLVNVLSDKIFYDESNGGVTISGGEVLFQPDFAEAILSLCKEKRSSYCNRNHRVCEPFHTRKDP